MSLRINRLILISLVAILSSVWAQDEKLINPTGSNNYFCDIPKGDGTIKCHKKLKMEPPLWGLGNGECYWFSTLVYPEYYWSDKEEFFISLAGYYSQRPPNKYKIIHSPVAGGK